MSDYLGHLIARSVSPAIAVCPRLPSLFEPAPPATREAKSRPEFEQESFMEQAPVTQHSEKLAPMTVSTSTPRQSALREPEQTVSQFSRPKRILEGSQESEPARSPAPIIHQSTLQERSRIFSGKEDVKPTAEPGTPVQPRILSRAASTVRTDKPSDSMRQRSEGIKSPRRDVMAFASNEVSAQKETRPSQRSAASKPVVVPEPREHKTVKRSGVDAIVPTIRSLPPIAPLSPPATTPPTINVTIGRVEVRAVPPPAQQRAKPKPASVLSLEDYLRQRAKGAA
jgi:hypothetical protein